MLEINKIFNCDYKEKIAEIGDGQIDLVLTDIPYMINRETNYKAIKDFTKKSGESNYNGMNYEFDDWDLAEVETYINHCCRILKKSGILIVWSAWQQLGILENIIKKALGMDDLSCRIGVWIKSNPHPGNCHIKPVNSCEYFLWVAKGSNATFNLTPYDNRILKGTINVEKGLAVDAEGKSQILEKLNMRVENGTFNFNEKYERLIYIEPIVSSKNSHPTKKPQLIFEHLVKTFSTENDLIFDGLMGSGTTARACIKTNRSYIGFERNKRYFDEAMEEINKLI